MKMTEDAQLKALALALCLAVLGGCGGTPKYEIPMQPSQNLGYDWREHFIHGIDMLQSKRLEQHKLVFTRAAFASAARFSLDHAPSYAGLGLAELNLGNFSEAQIAFLNAALIEDRSMYWALSAMAALRGGNEVVARTLFDAMQAAAIQDDDPASRFIRAVYSPEDTTYPLPIVTIPHAIGDDGVDENLLCDVDSSRDQPLCRNLNITVSVYFVRRFASDATTRGTGFFNDLIFRLGASEGENYYRYERNRDDYGLERSRQLLLQPHLSIPDIEYAVRLMPINVRSSMYVNAAPAVVTSIGEESEIREGADLTILFAGGQNSNATEYTAETGTVLHIKPESATAEYVKLKLEFESSSVATLEPALNAQVLNVATNKYTIAGYFAYGRPLVLGKLSNGSQKNDEGGQIGLRRTPLFGGSFGASREEVATSETLVLGVLSEPAVFRGSHEKRVLEAMRAMGIQTREYASIQRRKIVHQAPHTTRFLLDFLQQQRTAAIEIGKTAGEPDIGRQRAAIARFDPTLEPGAGTDTKFISLPSSS